MPGAAPTAAEYRRAIEDIIAIVEEFDSGTINPSKRRYLHLLHGLARYTTDTATAALHLIDNGMTGSAAVLVRVALEHGVLAQWLVADPAHADKYLAQQDFDAGKFKDVAASAGVSLPDDLKEVYRGYEGLKADRDVKEVRRVFKLIDPSEGLYLQYKYLCGYVHPTSSTALRYVHVDGQTEDVTLTADGFPAPVHAILFTLAVAVAFAVAPYVDLVKGKPFKSRLQAISEEACIPLWATQDGKPPKTRP